MFGFLLSVLIGRPGRGYRRQAGRQTFHRLLGLHRPGLGRLPAGHLAGRAPGLADHLGDRGIPGGVGDNRRSPVRGRAQLDQRARYPPASPVVNRGKAGTAQPIAPASAMFNSMSRFISTAYSIGSSFTIGSINPATTMDVA